MIARIGAAFLGVVSILTLVFSFWKPLNQNFKSTPTFGPTPTFTLHPDAVGSIQTLTALAGTVDAMGQTDTRPVQTLTAVANMIENLGQTATKAAEPPTLTPAATSIIIPQPKSYNDLVVFDQGQDAFTPCWINTINGSDELKLSEGFYLRGDYIWGFRVDKNRTVDQYVTADFGSCLEEKVGAIALNFWVSRLELQSEIGVFIENESGRSRDYTVWVDNNKYMYLRLRENDQIVSDYAILIVNDLKVERLFPREYAEFPIQILVEINNQGLDIVYLREGPYQNPVKVSDINPHQMTVIDGAVRPTLGNIKSTGLIGYGGESQVIVWPLAFLSDEDMSTMTPNPLQPTAMTPIGKGYIHLAVVTAWKEPNNGIAGRLYLHDIVTIYEQKAIADSIWYKCSWVSDGIRYEGWILGDYITFGNPPTP